MSFFKFSWLNSDERKELQKLRKEKEERESLGIIDAWAEKIKVNMPKLSLRPYKSLRLIGETTLVVLQDGVTLSGGKEFFEKVKECSTEEEIISLFTVREEKVESKIEIETPEEKQLIRDNWEVLRNHSDFIIKGDEVYLKGVSLPLPAIVAASFIEVLELIETEDTKFKVGNFEQLQEQYTALKYFWLKLCLNPLEHSREDLLVFIKNNDVRFTNSGNLILYRNLVTLSKENQDLVEFISNSYTKIKLWKKSTENYSILRIGAELKLVENSKIGEGENLGILKELYLNLPNMKENIYSSWHNKGRYKVRIGDVYKIDESIEQLNTTRYACQGGALHATNVNYDYSYFGDTKVVVLVNPSKVLTIPSTDIGKLTTREMFIACYNYEKLGTHFEKDNLNLMDDTYDTIILEELEKVVSEKDFSSLCIKTSDVEVNLKDISQIVSILKSRVVNI